MYWNNTITIYNQHEDKITGLKIWKRHTVDKCFVKLTNSNVSIGNVSITSNDTIIRIPYQMNYLSVYEWDLLSNYERDKYFTLGVDDIIILGDVNEDIDEYVSGKRASDIVEKYKTMGVIRIKAVNENVNLPNKHYFVRGVA